MEYRGGDFQHTIRTRGCQLTEPMYHAMDAVPITRLAEAYGNALTLTDEGKELTYELLCEFRLGDREYAVLRGTSTSEEEYTIFRITEGEPGALELESIDDDDEWEAVAEIFDEMTFEP